LRQARGRGSCPSGPTIVVVDAGVKIQSGRLRIDDDMRIEQKRSQKRFST